MEVKAISPGEAKELKVTVIHPDIITTINELIVKKYKGKGSFTIKQDEIVNGFMEKNPDFDRNKLFSDNHLDFEDIYRKEGWSVEYDKPAYYETYDAFFRFSARQNKIAG